MDKKIESTEDKIIRAAIEIFSQKGYNGTTTKEIAVKAKIAEGTIFRYFPKKQDLLHGILVKAIEIMAPKIIGKGVAEIFDDNSDKSDREILIAFMKNRLEIVQQNFTLIKVVLNEAQYHPDIQELFFQKVLPPIKGIIDHFFMEGIKKGRFRQYHPSILTAMMVGTVGMSVLLQHNRHFVEGLSKEEIMEQMADVLLTGISKN
ncbi:transcriptional regulator, TetR family [Geosporobacter subterraneus DSM 17957]|uniref:Transcriptional regulator, TetR family n=1 Tax=Geosporobacter subterraneus DSM 17957 TaxID=1121919 RepID=A0A1M6EVR3_9FIRM|nr:TetR/AcrR family transcriptional regulator [Geosporobacter subterraneus]SHI89506.1 transcriptional regulator, TetR family [Geosporobacter subterraneus DSM 17957]